ncbi:glycoside hydrolase family 95 protein [Chitinophaga sp. 22321]|uniref:Glycoside hydrolase family 95 protein n=1 Tax=Chitinophaga hostae TaxID=2831022 RepID=A0ABS5IXP2_9BACT|nr:glycoside hydrolase family 95 protein [Chitinophaga hostae]MBS0027742.1 glycoside hydrolase family 95 protein [Chitinophaga hostae]
MRKLFVPLLCCIFLFLSLVVTSLQARAGTGIGSGYRLWYMKPAEKWETQALPIGNGRMGAMLFGGIKKERVQFNEQSLWGGDNNWDGEYETGDHGFGSYRNFGEFVVDFNQANAANGYYRALDIQTGVHTTSFEIGDIRYNREAFASHPDQVMVFRYTASKKGALSGKISMQSAQGAVSVANADGLGFMDEMPNHLKYAANMHIDHEGGNILVEGNTWVFEKCNTITIYLDARTNYKPDYQSGWRGADPAPLVKQEISNARKNSYQTLVSRHTKDLTRLTKAASIDIGKTDADVLLLPTDVRLEKYAAGAVDPDLEETLFQYGRYLLASSSRTGGLPANLQGLWNDSNTPPWAGDYHNNINIQMNYWGVESTNLSDCHLPLIDFVKASLEPCRIATQKAFGKNVRGWTARTSQNIFGGNGWEWNIPSSAWYAQHVFEHWAFTMDKAYLRTTAYPILKEVCEFWEDRLKKMPDGKLMVPNGWSPEHGPREDGVMHDQQLVWDLFQNYLDAAKALGIDETYQAKVADMQAHLAPNKIGKWGQLQEWQEDRDDPDDQHRHTSHLFAVYPGRQISMTLSPDLAKAAIISLRSRSGNYGKSENTPFTVASTVGDSRRSWTWPWRCALWARLGEGEKAGIMVRGLLTYNTMPNLFTTHPPFQIDGNLGITGAVAEMLLQSHTGEIHLLPGIPAAWAANGSFKGLKARGGYTVDCTWKNGKVVKYNITAAKQEKVWVRVNGERIQVEAKKG